MTIEANKFRRKSALCRFMHGQPTKKLSISLDDAVTAGQRQARSKRTTERLNFVMMRSAIQV